MRWKKDIQNGSQILKCVLQNFWYGNRSRLAKLETKRLYTLHEWSFMHLDPTGSCLDRTGLFAWWLVRMKK